MAISQSQFHRMVTDHGPALYRMAYRMVGDRHEAEDIVQEAFRSAWKSRNGYQRGRSERAWLAAILRRRTVDHWRKKKSRAVVLASDSTLDMATPGEDPLVNDYTDEMQKALCPLTPEVRESLLLVVVAELTHQEAADVLGVPLGTVLSRVSRARRRLRTALLAEAKMTR